jgi:hypothetical protein
MKEGDNILVPGIKPDGGLFLAKIRKVFRDGSVWVEGKDGKDEVNSILTREQVEKIVAEQKK